MRLLNVHTLKFKSFDRLKPHYAAASHRWLSHGETSFRDVQAGTNLDSPGFEKVEKFAAFVREYVSEVDWLWIDTCCINTDSSPELQEAIISMYQWYESAAVCIAYLHDMPDFSGTANQDLLTNMRNSEWFTRGWTLQELLAPQLVLFLSHNWEIIGHKSQLSNRDLPMLPPLGPKLNALIAELTNIPEKVIDRPELRKELSTDEKLEWVATRVTKRPEDKVYCILGLLGVVMPLLYGEGETSAWRRLKREISQNDESSANRAERETPNSHPYNIPFSLSRIPITDYFVPRDMEVGQLEKYFLSQNGSDRLSQFVVYGMGGMGKSSLCAHFVRDYQDRFSAIFWLDASSRDTLRQSLGAIAARLQDRQRLETLTGSQIQETLDEDVKAVLRWLSISDNTEWLLIFDNLDRDWQTEPKDDQAYNYTDFLPSSDHGNVLITTRLAHLRRPEASIHLRDVPEGFARRVVQIRAGRELEDLDLLVSKLGSLPLALAQAGAFLYSHSMNVSEYLHFYDTAWSRLMQHQQQRFPLHEDSRSIATTWKISYDQVEKLCMPAARLLDLWTFFHFGDVWYELLSESSDAPWLTDKPDWLQSLATDAFLFRDAISVLSRYSLISVASEESRISIHPIIHTWCSNRMLSDDRIDELFETSKAILVRATNSARERAGRKTMWRIVPHFTALLKRAQHCNIRLTTNDLQYLKILDLLEFMDQENSRNLKYAQENLQTWMESLGRTDRAC